MTVGSIAPVAPHPEYPRLVARRHLQPADQHHQPDPGALTLTDNGQPVSTSGLSLTLVSGDTYTIGGLAGVTTAEGNYTLTVNAADITDNTAIPAPARSRPRG